MPDQSSPQEQTFRVEEATIADLHQAIRDGRTTCVAVVRQYLERARAYNGVASVLVTQDGAPIPAATGTVRALEPLAFPTQTIKASTILPDLDRYEGPPLEFGRMEPTASDPGVQQQFGMIAGIPDAGQLNALATLNIRGERSVTCRGDLRPASVRGAASARRAARLREFSPAAGRAGAGRRARRDLRAQSRPREDADVRRRVLVQGPVRHEGHAHHRRRRRALRHRFSRARSRAGRSAPHEGRDHLRQGRQHGIQRPRGRSGRTQQAGRWCCRPCSATSAARGPAIPRIPTTRRARPRSAPARARASRSAPTW